MGKRYKKTPTILGRFLFVQIIYSKSIDIQHIWGYSGNIQRNQEENKKRSLYAVQAKKNYLIK